MIDASTEDTIPLFFPLTMWITLEKGKQRELSSVTMIENQSYLRQQNMQRTGRNANSASRPSNERISAGLNFTELQRGHSCRIQSGCGSHFCVSQC